MFELHTLLEGIAFGESLRWHEDRLWFCDWGKQEVVAVDGAGKAEVLARLPAFGGCIDWLPGGPLLVSAAGGRLLRLEPDGSLADHADLAPAGATRPNEVVVDPRGNAFVNDIGFDLGAGGEYAPGSVVVVTPGGAVRRVADGLAFPNGMAVTPDGRTLVVAESYAGRLTAFDIDADGGLSGRRVWADLDGGVPDGICLDAEGAAWYADVPNRRCTRVAEGGAVLDTIELDRGCFSCALGGPDGRTLHLVTRVWAGMDSVLSAERTGQLLTTTAPARAAG